MPVSSYLHACGFKVVRAHMVKQYGHSNSGLSGAIFGAEGILSGSSVLSSTEKKLAVDMTDSASRSLAASRLVAVDGSDC